MTLIAIRRRKSPPASGFEVPFVPALPLLGIVVNLGLALSLWQMQPSAIGMRYGPGVVGWHLTLLWIPVGLIFHYFSGGKRYIEYGGHPPRRELFDMLAGQGESLDLERYRVLLPLREFEDVKLVEVGALIARERQGELSLLNVVEIPRNLPQKAVRFSFVNERIKSLQKLSKIGRRMGVDTRAEVKIGYKVYEIILGTVEEEVVNLLLVGWRGERKQGDRRVLGTNLDYLVSKAKCDVAIMKAEGMGEAIENVLVANSPHWSMHGADEIAVIIAKQYGAALSVLSVVENAQQADQAKEETKRLIEMCESLGISSKHQITYSRNVEGVILEACKPQCLLIIGTSPGTGLRKYAIGPVEDRIAKRAMTPVLIFKRGEKRASSPRE